MTKTDLGQIIREDFDEVFREQFPLVYNFACHHTSSVADAEDLTSDVFARAYRYWYSYSPEKGSRGEWIGGIARNTVKTYVRKKACGPKTTELSEFIPTDVDIESDYLRREYLQQIFVRIDALPERRRKLMIMKFIWGYTNKSIAEATGMSADNVGVMLHRIIKKLRISLQND